MATQSLVCVFVLFLVWSTSASRVPVLMWGSAVVGGGARPLLHSSSEDWDQLATSETKAHDLTVVFVEETLSPEDLSARDSEGRIAYPQLRTRIDSGRLAHLPAVPSPLSALRRLAHPEHLNRVRLTDEGLSADIHSATGKFLFIELEDAKEGEDRFRMLSRHDAFMNQMFDKLLEKHPSVLAIYTAHYPSWEIPTERVRRESARHLLQNTEAPESGIEGFYNATDKFYLFTQTMTLKTTEKNNTDLSFVNEPTLEESETNYNLTFTSDSTKLVFVIEGKNGYWSLDNVIYTSMEDKDAESEILSTADLYAPYGFSYSCGQTVYKNENITLTLAPFQVQPFFGSPSRNRFASSYDCVGTMSVPIWSGLFIVFLLLFIIIFGVMMMMDIKTMDRFDDPKGKTITINAAE